jgi:uncharacterized membrane protein YkvA (DUF1232 family)
MKMKLKYHQVWHKIKKHANHLGQKTAYSVLLLFYSFKRADTPVWAKNIIIGTLGYFLMPFDSIPDLTPILGFTDDIGVLSFGLVTIASYVNDDVRINARKKLKSIFGTIDFPAIQAVDKKL